MKIREYFKEENNVFWLKKISECEWDAGKYLAHLIESDRLFSLIGDGARVLLLTEGERLVSFCTLARYDDVQPTDLTPWIGWLYTFPSYRGNRYAGKLLEYAEELARLDGAYAVHISTNHKGLYEKYGYEFLKHDRDVEGESTRVYVKHLKNGS